MNGFDERKTERFSLQIAANLVVKSKNEKKKIQLKTSDISAGGAFFATEKPLPIGTKVMIDMILPLDELKKIEGKRARIEVTGSVVRTDETGMAVSFDRTYQIQKVS